MLLHKVVLDSIDVEVHYTFSNVRDSEEHVKIISNIAWPSLVERLTALGASSATAYSGEDADTIGLDEGSNEMPESGSPLNELMGAMIAYGETVLTNMNAGQGSNPQPKV